MEATIMSDTWPFELREARMPMRLQQVPHLAHPPLVDCCMILRRMDLWAGMLSSIPSGTGSNRPSAATSSHCLRARWDHADQTRCSGVLNGPNELCTAAAVALCARTSH